MAGLILRWSARVTGLLLVAMVLLFAIGEGVPNISRQPVPVQLGFFAMGLMLVGFLVGWRWEGVGGGLALAGFATFLAVELATNGRPPGGAIPWFVVPGLLYLFSYGWHRALRAKSTTAVDP